MDLYIVTGGVGRHAIFSSMIEKLVAKSGDEKIMIMSAYHELFKFHPLVEKSVSFEEPGFYDEVIRKENLNIKHSDPYYSNYAHGKTHLADEWANQLGISDFDSKVDLPDIYVDDLTLKEAKSFASKHPNFIITQFGGGQASVGPAFDPTRQHVNIGQIRDYPRDKAQKIVDLIKEENEDITILNYALPNEQTANLDKTISIKAPYLFYVALAQLSRGYICIDSSLLHLTANRYNLTKGVAIWGSTGPLQLGYEKNIDLTNAEEHTIRPLICRMGDLLNVDGSPWQQKQDLTHVDPEKVVSTFLPLIDENNVSTYNVEFTNVVEDKERIENEIQLDTQASQMITSLNAQAEGLKMQAIRIMEDAIKESGKTGRFGLSKTGDKLVRTGR